MSSTDKQKWDDFFGQLNEAVKGEKTFTIILEDPLASSYVQSYAAPAPDAQMTVEDYERTEEEEESLGLKDMKTEGYEADAPNGKADQDDDKFDKDLAKKLESGEVTLEDLTKIGP